VTIPTYKRINLLKECLDSVLPQVRSKDEVEVIVIDNASPDDTPAVVKEFTASYDCLKYYRNEENLGYAGNQVKCIEYTTGDYMAFLCDDDVYLDGQVDRILAVISEREYAFVALNYYGFIKNSEKPYKTNFVPEDDVFFSRAYDIFNYPTVGHFSGLVFNAKLAKDALITILAKKTYMSYEKYRGLIGEVAVRSTVTSNLPAYFIGKRGLAGRMPAEVDYDMLHHLCLDFYQVWYDFFAEGLISKSDLEHRAKETLSRLPSGIIGGVPYISNIELNRIIEKLTAWFGEYGRYKFICLPLLKAGQYSVVKSIYKAMRFIYRLSKRISWSINS
ncbi:MAG: glycosyltransferase family 2 protein, partial [Syntrophales bacterium]